MNKLRQIGTALHHYHDTHERLPPAAHKSFPERDPQALLSWLALILPQMEQASLYHQSERACQQEIVPSRNPPHVGFATVIPGYVCSSDIRLESPQTDSDGNRAAFTSYLGITASVREGIGWTSASVFGPQPGFRFGEIVDGMSQTFMVGERAPPQSWRAGWWYPAWLAGGNGSGPHNLMDVGPVIYYVGGGGSKKCD